VGWVKEQRTLKWQQIKIRAPQLLLSLLLLLVFLAIGLFANRAEGNYSRADVIIAGATVLYTGLTGLLLSVTYFANRPIVTLFMEREGQRVYLTVANNGNRPATNVRLTFSNPVVVNGQDLTQNTGIFKHPIGTIPAGGAITTGFGFGTMLFPDDSSEEQLAGDLNDQSDITIDGTAAEQAKGQVANPAPRTTLWAEGIATYADQITKRTYEHSVVLDARYLEGLTWFTSSRDNAIERGIRDSRNELRAIRRILQNSVHERS
jgi:hypothetical protein